MTNQTNFIKQLLKHDAIGGMILISCVIISLGIANSGLSISFNHLLNAQLGFKNSFIHLQYSTTSWVNDGLMTVFFLFVGLEIKREILNGELSDIKIATLPVFAAIGGMLVPALVFILFNYNKPTQHGWGIPMATDIAFAVAILTLLGKSIPLSLKVFLKALAIVDDLGAIIVIAVFYTEGISTNYLLLATAAFGLQLVFNFFKLRQLAFYIVPGILLWYFIHHSGIHATIAGVLTAFAIPYQSISGKPSLLLKLEHWLDKPVNFFILPLFALVNTAIHFDWNLLITSLSSPAGLGIIAGLVLGKPIGILLCSLTAVKTKLSSLPRNTSWLQLWGAGQLGGIGFTMSIFITLLSFSKAYLHDESKLAILLASVIAALAGYLILKATGKKPLSDGLDKLPYP
jgi:NhaA family Na+:H+ antiporter